MASAHQHDEEHGGAHAVDQGTQSTHRVECVELAGRPLSALMRWLVVVLVRRLRCIGGELGHLLGAEGQQLPLLVDQLLLLVDRDIAICHLQHKRLGKRVQLHQAVRALLQLMRELVHGQLFKHLGVGIELETRLSDLLIPNDPNSKGRYVVPYETSQQLQILEKYMRESAFRLWFAWC